MFQLWLYETDNCIDVHMGPNNEVFGGFKNGQGPVIGVNRYNTNVGDFIGGTYLSRTATAPITDSSQTSLNGTPPNGMVYVFNRVSTGIENQLGKGVIIIHLNPATEYIKIIFPEKEGILQVIDVTGKMIKEEMISQDKQRIDIHSLKGGLYFIKIETDNKLFTARFIK